MRTIKSTLTEKDIKAMDSLGLSYDKLESYKGYHRFEGMACSMVFNSIKEIKRYIKDVIIDG